MFFTNKCQNWIFMIRLLCCNIIDGIYMNNDYINVIDSKGERYRAENSQQTENT